MAHQRMAHQTIARAADRTTDAADTGPKVSLRHGMSGAFLGRAFGVVLVLATAAILVVELRHTDIRATLRHIRLPYLGLAVAAIVVSLVAAAYNLMGFTPLRLRLAPTVLAQLAVSGIRVVMPSAMSTPAVAARYLTRSGATTGDALATVGVAQTVQLAVTVALVGGFGLESGWDALREIGRQRLLFAVSVATVGLALVWFAIRSSARATRVLSQARRGLMTVIAHVRARPAMACLGILSAGALTATHILAFAFCVTAAGGHASILTLTTVYLASAAAGSLIPIPGGTGAVETALITGLTVAGVPLPIATTATLLSRIVAVWLLVLPGWLALVTLRRRALL